MFDALSSGGKKVGKTFVKTTGANYLGSAIRSSTKYGRRGANRGYKLMRNQFFRQYDEGNTAIDQQLSDTDDDGEFEPTEDELLETVDCCYFEKDFNAMKADVSFLSSINAASEAEYICHLEVEEIRRKKQHAFISGSLKFRVLANYNEFVDAIHQVGLIKDDLKKASNMCSCAKEHMRRFKDNVVIRGLMIPKLSRKKQHIKSVIEIIDAVRDIHKQYEYVMNYLETGQLCKAVDIIGEFKQDDDERMRTLRGVESMKELLIRWRVIVTEPLSIQPYVYAAIDHCLVNFSNERYSDIIEGVRRRVDIWMMTHNVEDGPHECNLTGITFVKLRDGLMEKIHTEILKTITGVSNVKDETLGIVAISKAIEPGLLLSCICKLCGRLLNIMWLYSQIIKCHVDLSKSDEEGSSTHTFHRSAVVCLKNIGKEVGLGIIMGQILGNAPKGNLDTDTVLHIFFVAITLVDVSSVFDESPNRRYPLKQAMLDYLESHFVLPQMVDILRIMLDDSFVMEQEVKMRLLDMPVVLPMDPQVYNSYIDKISRYFNEVPSENRNPYYTSKFLEVQDVSNELKMDLFCNTSQCIPNRACAILSSERLCNAIFQCVARVIARLPPLASESLTLLEDMISAYIYVVASNLIGFSTEIPVETYVGYTPRARKSLMRMKEVAYRTVPSAIQGGNIPTTGAMFPPLIFTDNVFKNIYSNSSAFYGLSHRITGVEAMFGIMSRYAVTVEAVAPLMSDCDANVHRSFVMEIKMTISELLEVGMQLLSTVILPGLDILMKEIKNINFSKINNNFMNSFIKTFETFKKSVSEELDLFPTRHSTDVFWCRCYYVIQSSVIEAVSTKKISSEEEFYALIKAVTNFISRLKGIIPTEKIGVFDNYALLFLNTFLYPHEGRMQWLDTNHDHYTATDTIAWLGGYGYDNRENRKAIEARLGELDHEDRLALAFDVGKN